MTESRVPYLDEYPQDDRFHILRETTGNGNRISIERIYIEVMGGDVLGGLFVSQLVFWSRKGKRKDGWFYRTQDEWEKRDYLSRRMVEKYTKACGKAGWLETKLMRANGAPTTHYRIKQAEFMVWLDRQADLYKTPNPFVQNANSQDLYKTPNPEHTPTYTYAEEAGAPSATTGESPVRQAIKLAQDEAVVLYRDILGRSPSKPQMQLIADTVSDMTRWREVVTRWAARGYKATNVDGMLEWYAQPERMGNSHATSPTKQGGEWAALPSFN